MNENVEVAENCELVNPSSIEESALLELQDKVNNLNELVSSLISLRQDNMFMFLSKKARNEMLTGIMSEADAIFDCSRAAFRALKKNKRSKVPEEFTDQLILDNRIGAKLISTNFKATDTDTESDD